ncbi:hypothetical protein VZT92_000419 [Zoarces viviparus]|uniref:Fibronectin type-III domain-containing protein n=1 Tax=Zoarces viviparus TaxID=48416 RepID=A0AAW1G5S5_ZOAVI
MGSRRRVRDRISFVLLILGNIATALSGQLLECTNDYTTGFFCHFGAQNCTEYSLTLRANDFNENGSSTFTQCDNGRCCCFVEMILIWRETHTAIVRKGDKIIKSQIFSVTDTIKPNTPTIRVEESDGNVLVTWDTHMAASISSELKHYLTYYKKGDTKTEPMAVTPTTNNKWNSYEILGRHLDPSTTYVVSVKTYIDISDRFSDSSEEVEFTTAMSPFILALVIIISLSFAAVIISGVIFICYVKLKTKWRDAVAKCPNPKLGVIHPSKPKVLEPGTIVVSPACVEILVPDDSKLWSKGSLGDTSSGSLQQSSGISSGSSCLSYANTEPADIIASVDDALKKAFANIGPFSPLTTKDSGLLSSPYNPCGVQADDMSCWSSGFDNKTYSILIPSCPHQIVTDSSEVQTPAEMLCDSAYHPSAGDIVTCVDPQAPTCPLVNSLPGIPSIMPMDMSYQQRNADSGAFSYAEDSSLSAVSSGTNTIGSCDLVSRVEANCENSEEAVCGAAKQHGITEGAAMCDENPCHGGVPAGSCSFPPVDDDYQPFQNLVKQPDVLLSEERSDEKEEHSNRYTEELLTKLPQSFPCFINNVQGGQCLSELQRPFLCLIPADQSMPLTSDSGYQCV